MCMGKVPPALKTALLQAEHSLSVTKAQEPRKRSRLMDALDNVGKEKAQWPTLFATTPHSPNIAAFPTCIPVDMYTTLTFMQASEALAQQKESRSRKRQLSLPETARRTSDAQLDAAVADLIHAHGLPLSLTCSARLDALINVARDSAKAYMYVLCHKLEII